MALVEADVINVLDRTGTLARAVRWLRALGAADFFGELHEEPQGLRPLARAASKDKRLHIAHGANHMSLYEVERLVNEAVGKLAPFFKERL